MTFVSLREDGLHLEAVVEEQTDDDESKNGVQRLIHRDRLPNGRNSGQIANYLMTKKYD